MAAKSIECDETADVYAGRRRRHLIHSLDRFQVNQHVRLNNKFFHHSQKIAAAADQRRRQSIFSRLLREGNCLLQSLRVLVGEGFHAVAPRILSRVIGKSLMRRPMELKTALPTAATA